MSIWLRHPEEGDLALFAGGELGPLGRWRIEGHLDRCSECRQAVSEFFELRSHVMDLAELPHVDWAGLAAGIHTQFESDRRMVHAAPIWRPAWSAALALFLLCVAGLYVSRRHAALPSAVLGVSAGGVELRVGNEQVLTLVNAAQQETQVHWRASADTVSARYLDEKTGSITVNNVYSQ